MKLSSILIASMLLAAFPCFAQDRIAQEHRPAHPPPIVEESTHYGWAVVLRVDPIYDQASEEAPAQQECFDEQPAPPPPSEHVDNRASGTVIGVIVGGVVGNIFGKGNGRKAATAVGAVAGGVIGNNIAAASDAQAEQDASDRLAATDVERHCRDIRPAAQHRIVGYDVEYRYGGEVYMVRLGYDPGDRMRVKVSVIPADQN